jgi:hypothetical protein
MSSIHKSGSKRGLNEAAALRETLSKHIMQTEDSAKGAEVMSFREDQDEVLEMILRAAAKGEHGYRETESAS